MRIAASERPGGLELDLAARQLRRGEREIALTPRAFALLVFLAERRGALASNAEILAAVWADAVVEEGQVRQFIGELRRALGDDPRRSRLIETVRGRGYRFIGAIRIQASQPPPSALAYVAALNGQGPPRPRGTVLHGRDDDRAALTMRLESHPLVTVVGAGGVGKSVLARQLAWQARARHPEGIAQVELAPLADPTLVAGAIAEVAGVRVAPGDDPLAALVAGLAGRRMLLVIDNAEHLLDEVAHIAGELRDGAPHVHLLVTSQMPLHIVGEHVYRLGPLPVPASTVVDPRGAESHGAVALFVDRARASDPGFVLDADRVGQVIDICRRLDGMPLALEWAAARLGTLGLIGLRRAIDDSLDATPALRGMPLRQRTLAAALDWTHALLTPLQQTVLRRMAVFAGPFERTAAEHVAADDAGPVDAAAVALAVEALADASLFSVAEGADGARRWRLLQVTRSYALERLAQSGELHAVRRRQIAFHVESLKALGGGLDGEGAAALRAAVSERYADMRGALEWAFSGAAGDAAAGAALAVALLPYWRSVPQHDEGRRWLHRPARAGLDADAEEPLQRLVHRLRVEGIVAEGPQALEQTMLMALARRLGEAELRDPAAALRQLHNAVDVARAAVKAPVEASHGTPREPAFEPLVSRALDDITAHTRLGEFDRGLDVVEQAMAALDRQEAEEAARRSGARRALLDAALRQELLRRDSFGAAERVLALARLGDGGRPAWSRETGERLAAFRDEGETGGITLSLQVAIELSRRRVETAESAAERCEALREFAAVLTVQGERDGATEQLDTAAAALREALQADPSAAAGPARARLLGELAHVLGIIGTRAGRIDTLRDGVDACRNALAVLTRGDSPRDWAMVQHRLGTALRNLGARQTGTEVLDEALAAYAEALKVHTPARDPLAWARTQQGIGIVNSMIARRDNHPVTRHRAIAAFREALREATRERSPLEWAGLQNNIGIELAALGEAHRDTATLHEAVVAYREALREYGREPVPAHWALVQHNLGGALRLLGEVEGGSARFIESVVAFKEALREHRRTRVPMHWAATKTDLGMALLRLGQHEGNAATLEESVRVLNQALEVRTRDSGEMNWAATLADLAEALLALGHVASSPGAFQQAAAACRLALQVLSPDAWPANHLRVRGFLAEAERLVASEPGG